MKIVKALMHSLVQRDLRTDPVVYLRNAFGDVSFGTFERADGTTLHACAVPNLYTLDLAEPDFVARLKMRVGLRTVWEVNALQGQGDTEQESARSLRDKILRHGASGALRLLQVQPGQDELPVAIGEKYEMVHFHDHLHDHESPRLANFVGVEYMPLFGLRVASLKSDNHSHLLLKR